MCATGARQDRRTGVLRRFWLPDTESVLGRWCRGWRLLTLPVDVVGNVFHEGAELFENLRLLLCGHVLLAQKKTDDRTEVLGADTGVGRRRVVRLDDLLKIADELGGKLKFTHVWGGGYGKRGGDGDSVTTCAA